MRSSYLTVAVLEKFFPVYRRYSFFFKRKGRIMIDRQLKKLNEIYLYFLFCNGNT